MDLKRKLARLSSPVASAGAVVLSSERAGVAALQAPAATAQAPMSAPAEAAASAALAAPGDSRARRLVLLRAELDALVVRQAQQPRRRLAAGEPCALPAEPRDTPAGTLYVRESRYGLDHGHGRTAVGACLAAPRDHIAKLALDRELAGVDPARLVFFDLETTGLAGGAGTLAFIVGLGHFDGGALRLEQLFLRRPGEELPLLRYAALRFAAASGIVSFNGKSFDWPLLRARFVLNRLAAPGVLPHLDLLHWARRVFRLRLREMRLRELEREVLGFERHDDIDGSLIPASYFAYLRDGDGGGLAPVFHHNAQDLLALAALFGRLVAMYDGQGAEDPRDHLGLAEVALRAGDCERALRFAWAAAEHPAGRTAVGGLRLAAELLRRRGEHAEAAALLERALAEAAADGVDAAAIRLRLAKLHEHRTGDLSRALAHARATGLAEGAARQERRVARLLRRLARQDA